MATLVDVAAELEKLGYTTQTFTKAGVTGLNLYGDDGRYPTATLWPPQPPNHSGWSWGHAWEYSASDQLSAEELATVVTDSLATRGATE